MQRPLIVFGTRPEAIKLGPIVDAYDNAYGRPLLLCTGQHTDLLRGTPAESSLADAVSLDFASDGSVWDWTHNASFRIERALHQMEVPSTVVVQGDTSTAYAAAEAAVNRGYHVTHVEAGLRTNAPEPWPEEQLRVAIAQLASLHIAPTPRAVRNLADEGIDPETIVLTGNSIVSALYALDLPRATPAEPPYILVTLHRRELRMHDDFEPLMKALLRAMGEHPKMTFRWPVHPAMRMIPDFGAPANVEFIDPQPYRAFASQLAGAWGLLTDSGGAVEEATTLGVPTAIFRNVNDRPEAVVTGGSMLYPPSYPAIDAAISDLVNERLPRRPSHIFGTPESAALIAEAIHDHMPELT